MGRRKRQQSGDCQRRRQRQQQSPFVRRQRQQPSPFVRRLRQQPSPFVRRQRQQPSPFVRRQRQQRRPSWIHLRRATPRRVLGGRVGDPQQHWRADRRSHHRPLRLGLVGRRGATRHGSAPPQDR